MSTTSTQNKRGEWVPAIPGPFYGWRKVICQCGRKFRTEDAYWGHYAYAHILGMEDPTPVPWLVARDEVEGVPGSAEHRPSAAESVGVAVTAMWRKKAEDAEREVIELRAELEKWKGRVRRGVATPPPDYDDQYVQSRHFREVCEERDRLEAELRTMTAAYDEVVVELADETERAS